MPNHSIQRTGASRSGRALPVAQQRLAPAADAVRCSMRLFFIIVALFALCGCQSHKAWSDHFTDMSLADDSRLSPREHQVIAAARSYLNKQNWKREPIYYKIERTKDGYEVFVLLGSGYGQSRSLYEPVRRGCVVLRKDLSFVRYVRED